MGVELKDKTLLKIAITGSLVGIALLILLSQFYQVGETSIIDIKDGLIGSDVKVEGTVNSIFRTNSTSIFTLSSPSELKIMASTNLSISEGDYVEVIGQIDEYKGEKEIIADRIRKIE
ncbi:MAG TPA: hypothetical protein VFF28_04585 [Candidatus Nanoarchaeia archaeon]|nr:hypothetical protein [Candidatus Nanoarchaeia archaeon]